MSDIDSFFAVVAREVSDQLDKVDPDASEAEHWVVIEDSMGVERSSARS